jgi:undecaprenyl-diphosphatase
MVAANARQYLALLGRRARPRARPAWLARPLVGTAAATLIAVLAATMITVDGWAVGAARHLPAWLIGALDEATDFGKSVRVLLPIALMLAATAMLARPALGRISRGVLAALAVRLGFLFAAICLPGLVFAIIKRLIGRARPLVEGAADPFIYRPFRWSVEYASLPSGHAIDAFAIATALGALWPRARPLLWTYAVVIALSRVVLAAHFPSDVLAGAFIGVVGVLLVREWFAARGLVFVRAADGRARAMPGPSLARIKKVVGQLLAP